MQMATEKQIEANRLNALKSTGPKTPETKAKTRLNAKRDGITGQIITLSEEDRPVFEKLKAELIADLAPKTVMELKLANSIAWDTWRLDHLRAVEMNMYALGTADPATTMDCDTAELDTAMSAALTFVKESRKIALLSIYEQRINRSIHKNLVLLRELQAERLRDFNRDMQQEIDIARANDAKGLPYQAPAWPSRHGYVFSTHGILAAANRESVVWNSMSTMGMKSSRIQFAGACDNIDPHRPISGMKMAAAA
jgi:hypothetical protein